MVRRSRRLRVLRWAAIGLVIALAAGYIVASVITADRLYHPVRWTIKTSPAQYGLPYETVHFSSTVDHIPLVGWYMGPRQPGGKTVLALHGVSSARDNYITMELAKVLVAHGYNVFDFDFRGHGESGGDTTTLGQLETRDVAGALAYLKTRGVAQVGVIGHSMGAATALLAAPDHPEMRAIVADSSFADLWTIVEREGEQVTFLMPLFRPGVELTGKLFYGVDPLEDNPEQAVARLGNRPVLLIQSTGDTLIPVSEAYKLQKAGAHDPNLQLWIAQGAGHVSAFADNRDEYVRRLLGFYGTYLK